MSAERVGMLALLQDVAESEHHLRHPEAFAAVVEAAGFVLERLPHKFVVSDPDAQTVAVDFGRMPSTVVPAA